MELLSIETTPSPNCIKLNLNELVSTKALTLQKGADSTASPVVAQQLLAIEFVQSVFLVQDFITLTRKGNADWQTILAKAAQIIGVSEKADSKLLSQISQPQESTALNSPPHLSSDLGHVEAAIQMFRGIPVQVRVTSADGQQARVALPERFNQALQRAIGATQADYIAERRWEPYQSPAGPADEVAEQVAEEIVSLIDTEELARLEAVAIANATTTESSNTASVQQTLLSELRHKNWKHRLKALQQIEVTPETFSAVVDVLDDEQSAVRRWAAALLGASGMSVAVEHLGRVVLGDPSAMVRRIAGDALSDLGDKTAMPTMCQALADSSKLVRWRAARFLNEMGDQSAVDALNHAVESEAEFDVRVEMMAALERIQGGGETQLPMWMRITQGETAKTT